MSQALSHLSLFLPLASSGGKSHNFLKPQSFLKPVNNGSLSHKKNRVIAMAMPGETRHNLDHLQKAPKHPPPPPPPPKKRTAPTPPIGLWDRFPTARTVQQMMERMMEDPLEYAGEWPSPRSIGPYGRGRTPWEIKEGEKEYKMRFDMPGMTKEDVRVWVEEKMLVLKAEKEEEQEEEEEEENGEEWSAKSYGKYSYRIALPENVQFEKIKAEVKDGVLYITIPKADNTSKILDINVK